MGYIKLLQRKRSAATSLQQILSEWIESKTESVEPVASPPPPRVWPLLIQCVLFALSITPSINNAMRFGFMLIGPAIGALLLVVWLLGLSRLPWKHRLAAAALITACITAAATTVHESVGLSLFLYGVPLTRRLRWSCTPRLKLVEWWLSDAGWLCSERRRAQDPSFAKPMPTPFHEKSTIDEIRQRFDADVERFSNLETGQSATIDAPLSMELIASAAAASSQNIKRVLDVGCGAGNNTLRLRQTVDADFDVDFLDLSQPMLDRAAERLSECNRGLVRKFAADFREAQLDDETYDVILAAAVLHHLRDDADWRSAFEKIYRLLVPGGSVWITDLVTQETAAIHHLMWTRYGNYLASLNGDEYRDQVFAYIDREDSPRPVTYQLELLRSVGFSSVELLHKNSCFAAFGAIKGG